MPNHSRLPDNSFYKSITVNNDVLVPNIYRSGKMPVLHCGLAGCPVPGVSTIVGAPLLLFGLTQIIKVFTE